MKINVIGTDSKKLNVTKTTVKNITIARNTVYDLEWNLEPTVNETLAKFFKDMAKDQAVLAAATDEAVGVVAQQNFFLPEIHTWENALAAIKAIDRDLAKLESEVNKDTPQWRQQRGELCFFRALCYFELFRTYGQAPIVSDGYQKPHPTGEVFKMITQVLKELMEGKLLPFQYESDKTITLDEGIEMTRPTYFAAEALMARVCLYASSSLFGIGVSKQESIQYCEEIINSGYYARLENYSELWGNSAFSNKELIFGVHFTTPSSAYNGIHPTEHMKKSFESGDIRLAATIGTTDAGLILNKPVDEVFPVFRYAEILLISAEAKEDVTPINQLRERAKLSPVGSFSLDYIENERFFEFAFEGHRFWDDRRWNKAGKFFETIEGVKRTWNENYNFYPVPQN